MNIFCSGIGGIGLSAYAAQMKSRGHDVSGSDKNDSPLLDDLRGQGILVSLRQDGSALPEHLDLLVYSEAIPPNAPERRLAKERGVRQISYFKALGELTQGTHLISIAGTHGKSSTTAMAARMLMECGKDPSVVVGTKLRELSGRNWRSAAGNLWVVESCEYRCSFHYLSPTIVLLTNTDGDHFDAFPTRKSYEEAFVAFLEKLPKDGVVITHGSDAEVATIVKKSGRRMIDADLEPMIELQTPGTHMRKNAQLVIALAKYMGIDEQKAISALSGFSGTWRRMEMKGKTQGGAQIIDDYAHHPVEIAATLQALREKFADKRIVCAFQPHTHDRTIRLWNEFASSFKDAGLVLLLPVYDARPDTEKKTADIHTFGKDIHKHSKVQVMHASDLEDAKKQLSTILSSDDVLVTMGAGNITKLSDMVGS